MKKADQLGAGRFGGATKGVSARRQAVAAATGVPTDGIAPPTELPLHRVSLNPDNPRSSLGDLTDLAGSLATHGQKQAITVMNRDTYIAANPEREADLEPDTTHVVIDGSSRLAAAREAQLTTIKVMVSDDQGSTSEELLESALVANIHRQDLGELDEARALGRLMKIHGSQTALAKRLHRSQGWVSQRLALLNLTPELQAMIGHESIKLLRAVGNKPAADQEAALKELKDEQARQEADKQGRGPKPAESAAAGPQDSEKAEGHYRVIDDATNTPPSSASAGIEDKKKARKGRLPKQGGTDGDAVDKAAKARREACQTTVLDFSEDASRLHIIALQANTDPDEAVALASHWLGEAGVGPSALSLPSLHDDEGKGRQARAALALSLAHCEIHMARNGGNDPAHARAYLDWLGTHSGYQQADDADSTSTT